MKKLFVLAAAAAALTFFAGCDPDTISDLNAPTDLKSYEELFLMNGDVHFKYVYTPLYGINSRLASLKFEYYEDEYDWENEVSKGLFLVEEGTTTYTWGTFFADGSYTGRAYDRTSSTWSDVTPTTYKFEFYDTWQIGKYTSENENYREVVEYEYDGEYLKKTTESTGYVTNYVWKDGDLVGYTSNYLSCTIGYSSEKNTLAGGVDPVLRINDAFDLGLAGKHSAHLATSILIVSGSGDFQNRELQLYTYTKDSKGRIVEVKIVRADPDTKEPFQEDMHTQLIRFNY